MNRLPNALRWCLLSWCLCLALACAANPPQAADGAVPAPGDLDGQCQESVGPPRVERVSERVWVAIGHDVANTVVIVTGEGLVVVDAGMTPARARQTMAAFKQVVPWGPVKALILTHSHIDHVGGAAAWAAEGTAIWASERTGEHLLKQYSRFAAAERTRGQRQFGQHVPRELLPCSALGRGADLDPQGELGILMPDHGFAGRQRLDIGGVEIELVEAPGETHDHLFVWLPGERVLIAGDDYYWAFPNLYTIRGASPRPVDQWIVSLDAMRARAPEHLVPCHTKPLHGAQRINEVLTDYRDAIQWVRDQVVRRANQGQDIDTIASRVKLPPHLANKPYLREIYGQVDWSAKAIYVNNLGWFDGRPEKLYPPEPVSAARREVELMGGAAKVMDLARQALEQDDPRWATHLLAKLKEAGLSGGPGAGAWRQAMAQALTAQALKTANTNGRAYLLESAHELLHDPEPLNKRALPARMVGQLPVDYLLDLMASRLDSEASLEVHQSLELVLPDLGRRYFITQRRGVAEVAAGQALPGTPEPVATLTMDSSDFRQMVLGLKGPLALQAAGKITVRGGWLKALAFLARFQGRAQAPGNG